MSKAKALGLIVSVITVVILLAGCSQEPTPWPTPPPTATTPAPTLTVAPSLTPTATPTPEPAELSVPAYLEICQEAVSALEFDVVMLDGDEDFTWGEFADSVGALVDVHQQLNPPQELQQYHDASLAEGEALLANTQSRPGENSFTAEFALVFVEILGVAFEIGFDTALTDDEKEQRVEESAQEIFGEFFGPDFVAAAQAGEEARESLSEETLALVDGSGCYSDILGDSTTGEVDQEGTGVLLTSNEDRTALEALYNATNGDNWSDNTNWLSDAPLGAWHGVETDGNGRVTRLDLTENQLSGEIPAALSNLVNLEGLRLGGNQLSGEIPAALSNLVNLEGLRLGGNQLSGEIPAWLGNLENLLNLDLSRNQLSGEIPAELGNPAYLSQLYLDGNQLSGCIPSGLQDLIFTDLDALGLPDC